MLDDIGGVANDAGYQHFAGGEFYFLPDAPLMLVARIGGFDRNRVGFDFKNDVDDVAQRDVVLVRAVVAAPTGMKANRDRAECRAGNG